MRKLTLFFASLFLCMGMAWAQAESVLAGEGTEANPYLIESVDDLVLFRNSVNAGEAKYNAKGVYVALGADIDLSDENWAPIGSDKNHEFKGIFDGREHTVSNLKIESADLEYAGLFGYANGATIKNVNVKNVDISAYAHVAAIAGIVYTGNVENCHVSGTINLVAKYAYSAGIAADGYVNVRNCSVIAEGTGVITVVEKTGAGGITGWRGEGNLVIENCTVKNLDITAWASLGSISGIIHYDNSVTGCTVENVKLTKTRENGQGSVGVVSGNWERKADGNYTITVKDNSFTNVEINGTAINNLNLLLGSNYTTYITIPEDNFVEENNTLTNVASNLKVVAKTYNDLKLALAYSKDGETVELGADIELGSQNAQEYFKPAYNRESYCGIVIPDDKAVTLDLNGKTVSYTDTYGDVDNVMILNLGNLTIDDSSAEKNGKLTYKAVAGTSTYSKFYSTIFNCGTLTINAGTVENTCETETDVTNAVDNHSRLSHEYGNDCVLTVNGGILSGAYYYAIRQYTHYLEGVQNRVVINDGDINGGVYMQYGDSWYYADPANNRLNVDCNLTIIGGNINLNTTPDAFGKIRSRLNNPDNNAFGLEIKGGNINVPVELLVQRGYYYTNGVSGATTPTEAAGTRNAEWLEKNGGFITGGTFAEMGSAEEPTMNVAAFVAEGYQLKANEDGTGEVIVEPALSGEGTEDNPYLINNIDDLILFRNSVNVGETKYNADGVYVALGADIDMAGIDWSVNIGDDCSATFDGIFDGQGHTIYNLTATETAKKADGYVCTGLFGAIYGNAVVKNFTIENVSINTGDFTGNNAAAVVGFAYSCAGSIENVTVTGDININAAGVTGVGAIVGYDYYSPSLVVKGCEVKGNDGSAIVGKSYVGGLVGYASSKIALNNNTVENIDVEGVGSVGAIAGIMLGGSSADANTVKNVAVSATGELWANSAAVVAGTITGGGVTVANTTVEDVTANGAEAALVGGVLVEKPTAPIAKVAAKIGDTYYTTLEELSLPMAWSSHFFPLP